MFTSVQARSAAIYKRVGVETGVTNADPHQLIHMLFDGLQAALSESRAAMQRGDVATKVKQINKAVRILDEGLKSPLNLEEGGEVAANLFALYDYCTLRLVQSNAKNDVAGIDEVLRLIAPIASSWQQIRASAA